MKKLLVLCALSLCACFNVEKSSGMRFATPARLMVQYFDENIADLQAVPRIIKADNVAYKGILEGFLENTKEEYVSVYRLLPAGLFSFCPRVTPGVTNIGEIVDYDMAVVSGLLQILRTGNEISISPTEASSVYRLQGAQEFIREVGHNVQ